MMKKAQRMTLSSCSRAYWSADSCIVKHLILYHHLAFGTLEDWNATSFAKSEPRISALDCLQSHSALWIVYAYADVTQGPLYHYAVRV